MNPKSNFDTIGMQALRIGPITTQNTTRISIMKPIAQHMLEYGIHLIPFPDDSVSFLHLTIGNRVSPQGFSLIFLFHFYLIFLHLIDVAARVCRSPDSNHGQT